MAKNPKGVYEKTPGSGVWWVRYADTNGVIRREVAGTKSNAVHLYGKRKNEVREGRKLPELRRRKSVTFGELAKDALEYSGTHKLSASDDTSRMQLLTEWFGGVAADSITPQMIDRKLTEAAKSRSWRPATANRYKALLSLAYRLAVQNGKVNQNPARLVRPRNEDNGIIRFLDTSEETSLRETIDNLYREHLPEFIVALNTGMRAAEQYGLTWDRVDLKNGLVSIRRSKNGKNRHVSLNAQAIMAFEELQTRPHTSNGPVFCDPTGKPYRKAREWFESAVKKSGIVDFTWHCLRHTFASRLVMAGVNLRTVQELMGHLTIGMTVRYAHLSPDVGRSAVTRMEEWAAAKTTELADTKTDTGGRGNRNRNAKQIM